MTSHWTEEQKKDAERVRGILWRWGRVEDTCRELHRQLAAFGHLRDEARALAPPRADGMPRPTTPSDPTARAVERAMRLEEEYADMLEHLHRRVREEMRLKTTVDELLATLPAEMRELARLRYGERRSWVNVGVQMDYSEAHVRRLDARLVGQLGAFVR